MRRFLLLLALAGCEHTLDVAGNGLTPIDDYPTWVVAASPEGPVPGHGDTIRIVYANPVARNYSHSGAYQVGTVLVKEIYERRDDGSRGALRYLAVMRKVGKDTQIDAPVDRGWIFSYTRALGEEEETDATCFATCHQQAPYDSAWYDYGQ